MIDLSPIQTAIYSALTAAPATYPVYDAVPQGVPKPYIVIGAWSGTPDEELEVASADASVQVHAWSATAGKSQAHAMLQFCRARLDNQTITGVWAISEDFAEIMEDPKSTAAARIYHATARYRIRAN